MSQFERFDWSVTFSDTEVAVSWHIINAEIVWTQCTTSICI